MTAVTDLDLEKAVYAEEMGGSYRGFLAQSLYNTACWREGKAEEYPDDDRNLPAAEHLTALTRELLALPADDPRIEAIDDLIGRETLADESDIIRTIGFSWGYPTLDAVIAWMLSEYEAEYAFNIREKLADYNRDLRKSDGEGIGDEHQYMIVHQTSVELGGNSGSTYTATLAECAEHLAKLEAAYGEPTDGSEYPPL